MNAYFQISYILLNITSFKDIKNVGEGGLWPPTIKIKLVPTDSSLHKKPIFVGAQNLILNRS